MLLNILGSVIHSTRFFKFKVLGCVIQYTWFYYSLYCILLFIILGFYSMHWVVLFNIPCCVIQHTRCCLIYWVLLFNILGCVVIQYAGLCYAIYPALLFNIHGCVIQHNGFCYSKYWAMLFNILCFIIHDSGCDIHYTVFCSVYWVVLFNVQGFVIQYTGFCYSIYYQIVFHTDKIQHSKTFLYFINFINQSHFPGS